MKKILFILLVVSVLMLGACSKKVVIDEKGNIIEAKGVEVIEGNAQKTETTTTTKVTNDLKSMLKSGVSSKCTLNDVEGNNLEVWIKGAKSKQKIVLPDGVAWTIKDSSMIYTWTEGQPFGIKADLMQLSQGEPLPVPTPEQIAAIGKNVNCQAAALSDADFALPSGLEFMSVQDFAALGG